MIKLTKNLAFLSILLALLLIGCMDTATRLWNSGPYVSQDEKIKSSNCKKQIIQKHPNLDGVELMNEISKCTHQ